MLEAVGGYEVMGFVDDRPPEGDMLTARGQRLLGDVQAIADLGVAVEVVVAFGDPQLRLRVASRLDGFADVAVAAPIVHPAATVGSCCALGRGTVVAAGARLTTNVRLGSHCYVGPNATVGHDTVLRDGATIYPGAVVSGNVVIGRAATIGAGAAVKQGVHIGADAFVALGAGVVHDVPDGATVAGTPARRLGSRPGPS